MIRKLNLGNNWYVRFNPTILHGLEVLLGFNYCEGFYKACKDITMKDCITFDYAEFQIGLLIFTIAIGKEQMKVPYGAGNQIEEDDPFRDSEFGYECEDKAGKDTGDSKLPSDNNEGSTQRMDSVRPGNGEGILEANSQGDTRANG